MADSLGRRLARGIPSQLGEVLRVWLNSIRTWTVDMTARQVENRATIAELVTDHGTNKAVIDEIKARHNDHRGWLTRDGIVGGSPLLAVDDGTATKAEIFGAFNYYLSNRLHYKPLAAGIEVGTHVINSTHTGQMWGAWWFTIDEAGSVTVTGAAAATMDYASEFAALTAQPTLTVGDMVISVTSMQSASSTMFTAGTDDWKTADAHVAAQNIYDNVGQDSGALIGAPGTISVNATDEQFDLTALTIKIGGLEYTISAGTGNTFTTADTINTGTATAQASYSGGWLILESSGGSVYTLAPASDQTYSSAASAGVALDTLKSTIKAQVGAVYAVVGRIVVTATAGADWVAGTDDLTDGSDCLTATLTPADASGVYATTNTDGAAIPAAVANSGAVTLSNTAPTAISATAISNTMTA